MKKELTPNQILEMINLSNVSEIEKKELSLDFIFKLISESTGG